MHPARLLPLALAMAFVTPVSSTRASADKDWAVYLGDKGASHYSILDQITADNVSNLELAWTWQAGDARDNKTQIQCNPLVIGGIVYATTPQLDVVALDGATGRQRWRFNATSRTGEPPRGVNRGLAYWANGADQRIYFASGRWLHAINSRTGKAIESFGEAGRINLADLNHEGDQGGLAIEANTPGIIFQDTIIMGMRVGEGPAKAAPGSVRAFDVRTGKLVWQFNTIPQPGEVGYETWPKDAYKRVGGVNVWTGMTLDEERGIVYCPVGSASFDFWGGDRHGDNLFANCLLALDARTGSRIWHYQFVKHDVWDRDPPSPPTLFTFSRDGVEVPAVAQTTKSGHVWVFNRETGEALFPIKEVIAPSSDLAGELTSPVQYLPTKPEPFARQVFTADEITNRTPEAHRAVLEKFIRIRPHGPFVPPSTEGTIIFPGFDGAAEWGGSAVDPNGVLYVNSNEMPWILTMLDAHRAATPGQQLYLQNCAGCHGADRKGNPAQNIPSLVDLENRMTEEQVETLLKTGRAVMPSFGFLTDAQRHSLAAFVRGAQEGATGFETSGAQGGPPYTHTGYNRWFDPEGYPAVRPPWGTLNAINLNTGEYLWRIPLGEYPELTAKGMPITGTENYGGPLVTAGGVLFIAATKDERFRAIDIATGKELWSTQLPAGGYATPSTYEAGGEQFVVIACGGGKMGTKSGDSYLAFRLKK